MPKDKTFIDLNWFSLLMKTNHTWPYHHIRWYSRNETAFRLKSHMISKFTSYHRAPVMLLDKLQTLFFQRTVVLHCVPLFPIGQCYAELLIKLSCAYFSFKMTWMDSVTNFLSVCIEELVSDCVVPESSRQVQNTNTSFTYRPFIRQWCQIN